MKNLDLYGPKDQPMKDSTDKSG